MLNTAEKKINELVFEYVKKQIGSEKVKNILSTHNPARPANLFESTAEINQTLRIERTAKKAVDFITNNLKNLAAELALNKMLHIIENLKTIAPSEAGQLKEIHKDLLAFNNSSQNMSSNLCQLFASLGAFNNVSEGSDYPDLLNSELDYDHLLEGDKSNTLPCIKGGRPVNVSDGCEIKTTGSGKIQIDLHCPRTGLFVVFLWSVDENIICIDDVFIAFLLETDFTKVKSMKEGTTIKWNTNPTQFISLLTGKNYGSKDNTVLFQ